MLLAIENGQPGEESRAIWLQFKISRQLDEGRLPKKKLAEKEKELRGYQSMIQLVMTIEKISQEGLSAQSNAALLKKLEDQVNRQSKS